MGKQILNKYKKYTNTTNTLKMGKTKAGASAPAMGGLIGRKAGATKFKYSGAMKKSGIVWTEKHIFAYLQAPGKYVPGNRMAFAGIGDAGERGHLIAYLKTL